MKTDNLRLQFGNYTYRKLQLSRDPTKTLQPTNSRGMKNIFGKNSSKAIKFFSAVLRNKIINRKLENLTQNN